MRIIFDIPRRQDLTANSLFLWFLDTFNPLFFGDSWNLGAGCVVGVLVRMELHDSLIGCFSLQVSNYYKEKFPWLGDEDYF